MYHQGAGKPGHTHRQAGRRAGPGGGGKRAGGQAVKQVQTSWDRLAMIGCRAGEGRGRENMTRGRGVERGHTATSRQQSYNLYGRYLNCKSAQLTWGPWHDATGVATSDN
jgi:hypothetical protein